ncbi:nuclear transport factor 2 family protein [Cloacibacterium caeni]|uniref:nuclear transport factor 2 family protein n=1 Tax=Cloacibacterium caeni TaxID=2004710 RepID=UPI001BCFC922|nr:nuclear transport factor 2 family protein [Cloacibacterium caeni]
MKNILIFSVLFLFFSCKKEEEKIIKIDTTENEKIAKQLFVEFNKHDWQKMANLYIENAEFKEPGSKMKLHKKSREQIVKEYSELQMMFPDVQDSLVAIYPSGKNNVIVEFVSKGTNPDKTKFELPICTIFTIENGKITKDFSYFDNSQN